MLSRFSIFKIHNTQKNLEIKWDVHLLTIISRKIRIHVILMTWCNTTNLLVEQIMFYKKVVPSVRTTLVTSYKCEIMMDWNLNRVIFTTNILYILSDREASLHKNFNVVKIVFVAVLIWQNIMRRIIRHIIFNVFLTKIIKICTQSKSFEMVQVITS